MKNSKPFKLTFKHALQKTYNYWKRGVLQVLQGGTGNLYDKQYGFCAIGCSIPKSIAKEAQEKNVLEPVELKKKGYIKASKKDIRNLTKLMQAHDAGEKEMRDFLVKYKMLKK